MNEESPPILIPEWVVTFGDMMSLLLTFFIMLVSMSEIKHEDRYQALADSMREQFGYARSQESPSPGEVKPRSSQFSVLSTMGRAKKKNTARGGVPEKAPVGEEAKVRVIRPGQTTAVGSVVFFEVATADLDAEAKHELDITAAQLLGKPQKIEIRGHCTAELTARTVGTDTGISLAYQRSLNVMHYLVEKHGIPAARFRLSTAGDSEPVAVGDVAGARQNSRAEVFLLDETVDALRGDAARRESESELPPEPMENIDG
ncbi:MAG: OmpA/MotB family protein [Planctomycetaceae bacterium]